MFLTVCAPSASTRSGTVANDGPQGFTCLVVRPRVFVAPCTLLTAEVGSAFTQEGGAYKGMKTPLGRLHGGGPATL